VLLAGKLRNRGVAAARPPPLLAARIIDVFRVVATPSTLRRDGQSYIVSMTPGAYDDILGVAVLARETGLSRRPEPPVRIGFVFRSWKPSPSITSLARRSSLRSVLLRPS